MSSMIWLINIGLLVVLFCQHTKWLKQSFSTLIWIIFIGLLGIICLLGFALMKFVTSFFTRVIYDWLLHTGLPILNLFMSIFCLVLLMTVIANRKAFGDWLLVNWKVK